MIEYWLHNDYLNIYIALYNVFLMHWDCISMIRLRLLHITILFLDPDYILKSIPAGKSITVIMQPAGYIS